MKPLHFLSRHSRFALGAIALAVVAACGGGGTTAGTSPGETVQRLSGTITGFGSVIIDGVRFDDRKAAVGIDGSAGPGSAGTLADLKLGMHVEGTLKDGELVDVEVDAALVGPVAVVDANHARFVVYGQAVRVVTAGAGATVFDGVADLAGLAAGDVVEVHGSVDADHAITATRVERKPKVELARGVRVGGVVNGADPAARTFRLNDLRVDYAGAGLQPAGASLAEGQLALVFADAPPSGGVLQAKTVRIVGADAAGGEFAIGGRVMRFASIADFTVNGVTVDAGMAGIEGGSAGDVAAGVIVAADGLMDGGVLHAKTLRVMKAPADLPTTLKGEVTDWVSAAAFKLRGTPVDARNAVFAGGTAADLGAGAQVAVRGHVQGSVVVADSIEFLNPPAATPVTLRGEVRDWNAAGGRFRFLGATLQLAATTEYVGGTRDQLADGRRVAITGLPAADGIVAVTRLEFLPEQAPQSTVAGGRVFDIAGDCFKLPALSVCTSGDTAWHGGEAGALADGASVLVVGRWDAVAQVLRAQRVDFVAPPTMPTVAGTVGSFVTASDFRIGNLPVDAGAASFVDGGAAQLVAGALVVAEGSVIERNGVRVLVAQRLRFLIGS